MDTLRSILTGLGKEGAAIGHFNVSDLVLLKAVVAAAVEVGVPVMIGCPKASELFLIMHGLVAIVRRLREQSGLQVFLNADHTH